jgi:hypothetical protein
VICRANPLASTSSPSPDSGTHAVETVGVFDREPFGQALPPTGDARLQLACVLTSWSADSESVSTRSVRPPAPSCSTAMNPCSV